jgi:transcriptional regulator of acetoin/glycerol metabolism
MQPAAYPVQAERLAQIWHNFMAGGQLAPDECDFLDPAVHLSWQRCAPRLDPLTRPRPNQIGAGVLAAFRHRQSHLITMAAPFMEDIHQFVEGSGCAILLADGSACLLELIGDPPAVAELDELGLGQGSYWSEGQLGTNALALVLDSAMPVQVAGPEHFFRSNHHLVTTAAPIHDVRGRIVGILGVVSPLATATPHTLGLVMSAARAISNQLLTDWYLEEANLHLSEVNTILGAIEEGVVAWDKAGRIQHVNAQAGQILGIEPATILGRPLAIFFHFPAIVADAIVTSDSLSNVEVDIHVSGQSSRCLVSLQPIVDGSGESAGHIAMLRPIEQVRQLVHQQMGSRATLTLEDLSVESSRMRQVIRQARIAARGQAPVLIRGEGGVGKNHLARAIHNDSPRAERPFMAIDCRAIPHELMASELLGHEKEGQVKGRPSKFELAYGGTLLLDEIENLSLEMQAALLQVLESGQVMRLGSTHPIPLNIRIMATTTTDLGQLVSEGSFNSHLYYRFGVFSIAIPPLRERVDDIPILAGRFLKRISQRDGRVFQIDDETMTILCRYPWPGNVREMESVLERAISHNQDGILHPADLPEVVRSGRVISGRSPQPKPVLSVTEAEREAILQAGWACRGHLGEMAQQLGIGRTTLWRKMKRHNLSTQYFKQ